MRTFVRFKDLKEYKVEMPECLSHINNIGIRCEHFVVKPGEKYYHDLTINHKELDRYFFTGREDDEYFDLDQYREIMEWKCHHILEYFYRQYQE